MLITLVVVFDLMIADVTVCTQLATNRVPASGFWTVIRLDYWF